MNLKKFFAVALLAFALSACMGLSRKEVGQRNLDTAQMLRASICQTCASIMPAGSCEPAYVWPAPKKIDAVLAVMEADAKLACDNACLSAPMCDFVKKSIASVKESLE